MQEIGAAVATVSIPASDFGALGGRDSFKVERRQRGGKGIAVNVGDGDEEGAFGLGAGDEAEELLGGAGV
ncbi:hypothetical protein ACFX13_020311 [Malus domestica]